MYKTIRAKVWLKFVVGMFLFALFFGFFASGYAPPGIFGEVLRHNQANNIDASPLLYMEVEHMSDLEDGVREMREEARIRAAVVITDSTISPHN